MHRVKRVAVLLIALACLSRVHAANVVWPAVVLLGQGVRNEFVLSSDLSAMGRVSVWMVWTAINPAYATVEATDSTAGNLAVWFETTLNQPVDANAVTTTPPFCNIHTGEFGMIDVTRNVPFYIGFVIDGGEPGPIYGWASIYWNGTGLVLLDSAAETTGAGIYAGTYTPMPEPSAAGLALLGLATLALRRRRRTGKRPGGS